VVSDDFFPYRVMLDASSLDDSMKDKIAFSLGKNNRESVQWSNLVLRGKKELDAFVRVMREEMTKSRAEKAQEEIVNGFGGNRDKVAP
jgi:hypothetical protein